MTDLKELSERLAWEALEKSGNTKTGRSVMREAADVLAALGETHVVVPKMPTPEMIRSISYDVADSGVFSVYDLYSNLLKAAVPSPDRGEHKNG